MGIAGKLMGREVEASLIALTDCGHLPDGGGWHVKKATAQQVADATGCSKNTARKYLEMLVGAGCATREVARCRAWGEYILYYALPFDGREPIQDCSR